MRLKKKILATIVCALFAVMIMPINVFATEENFEGCEYRGTGYTTNKSGSYELVAKIDTYYYVNLSDLAFCASDVYFYKRNSAGTVVSRDNYGYTTVRFEKGSKVYSSSGRKYGYGNVEAWSQGCSIWINARPCYYATALR